MFLSIFLVTSTGIASPLTIDYSQYLQRISPNEGLSQSHVTSITQDKQGYLWIGTQMGLNRYDGYKVEQISGPDAIFEKELISTLFVDQEGYLWVSTMYSGLFRLDPQNFETEQFYSGKINNGDEYFNDVTKIIQQNDNELILGIADGLYRINLTNKELTQLLQLKSYEHLIRDLLLVGDSILAASSDGLYQINLNSGAQTKLKHKPENFTDQDSNNTKLLIRDERLGLLVGTVNGLFQVPLPNEFDSALTTPKVIIPDLNIWDMIKVEDIYYVATDQGLYQYDAKNNQLDFLLKFSDSQFRTTDNNIIDIYEDHSNNLWLASKSLGLLKWPAITKRFQHLSTTTSPAVSQENVWAIHQDDKGDIWIGTENGLNQYNIESQTVQHYFVRNNDRPSSGREIINSIFRYKSNSNLLWLDTGDGLYIFNKKTGTMRRPKSIDTTKALIEDPWIFGVFVVDEKNIFFINEDGHYQYDSTTGLVNELTELNQSLDIELSYSFMGQLPDKPNTTLLATSGHLLQYDLISKRLTTIYKVQNYKPQSFDFVDNWLIDNFNTLWISVSGEGLVGLDASTYEEKYRFDKSGHLATNHIYSLQLDAFQNLWFSSQSGLYRLNLSNMHIEMYTPDDGLLTAEFNGYAFEKLQDNRLAFGTPSGITFVTPELFQKAETYPKTFNIALTAVSLSSSRKSFNVHPAENQITLAYDDYGLNLSFSTLQFVHQDKTTYNFRLTGPSPLNLKGVKSNELLLSKLQAGSYELFVTAIDPTSGLESEPMTLYIRSQYAPWASPMAKVVYFLIFLTILIIYLYGRFRRNALLMSAHKKVKDSRNQMQLALHGSNSGIWDYHIESDQLFQERLFTDLGHPKHELPISLNKHVKLIKREHAGELESKWQSFINGENETWDVTYQIQSKQGDWHWYRDIGKIIKRDKDGKPSRVTGTYTNITQTKANETRALLFGDAFSQINDWVLILDANKRPVTANESFLQAFEIAHDNESLSLNTILDKLGEQKNQEFNEILDQLGPKQSWQGEEVINTAASEQHPVLIKITAISNNQTDVTNYVIVLSDITTQKHAEEKLRHIAHYDYLTDLPNRKLLMEKIESKLHDFEKHFALFFIDLDKFKQVNDLYGHAVGDKLLKRVASILVANVQHHDIVARQSGDEFIILIDDFSSLEQLGHLAQDIIDELSKPILLNQHELNITSSIGISIFPSDADTAAGMIKKADLAMIHAKRQGRGEFQLYTQDLNDQAHQRLVLENQIKSACQNREFINYYQPIVNHSTNKVVGVELLMRWVNEGNMVSPGVFIPVAEEMGLISQMTIDAIDATLQDYLKWQSVHPDLYISINLSPVHILQEGLSKTLSSLLEKHNLPPKVLRLEITEGTLLADLDVAIRRLNELRIRGFKLLLDDFGTGYSSMTYLSKFPIDFLKIDKSFTLNIQQDTNRSIIKSIITLADNLNLTCIAEGVETDEQLSCVTEYGCELIQGFYYAKPMPISDFMRFTLPVDKNQKRDSA